VGGIDTVAAGGIDVAAARSVRCGGGGGGGGGGKLCGGGRGTAYDAALSTSTSGLASSRIDCSAV
jgi:hypothetical protein